MSIELFIEEMFVLYAIALTGFIMRKVGVLDNRANHVFTQLLLYIYRQNARYFNCGMNAWVLY